MAVTIQFRRDTAANWTSANPTLAQGELGLEYDTGKFKVGNGSSNWAALSYGGLNGVLPLNGVPLSAKGSILAGNGTEAVVRTVGINGQALVADSNQTSGLAWVPNPTIKGTIAVGTGSAPTLISVGTNDYVLTADSATASGVKWAPSLQEPSTTEVSGGAANTIQFLFARVNGGTP